MMSVLLIEPDKLLAQTYQKALKEAGIGVQWEASAQNAVMAIDKKRPDLIVLELQLTGHNGVEFLHELRSQHDWQDIPVLLHTLVPITDLQLTPALQGQLGIVGYLYKPQTSLKHLVETIKKTKKT